ncbi:MAG: hypothetical protein ABIM99_05695 [Candidatus Dojkabacteria bacterium]
MKKFILKYKEGILILFALLVMIGIVVTHRTPNTKRITEVTNAEVVTPVPTLATSVVDLAVLPNGKYTTTVSAWTANRLNHYLGDIPREFKVENAKASLTKNGEGIEIRVEDLSTALTFSSAKMKGNLFPYMETQSIGGDTCITQVGTVDVSWVESIMKVKLTQLCPETSDRWVTYWEIKMSELKQDS